MNFITLLLRLLVRAGIVAASLSLSVHSVAGTSSESSGNTVSCVVALHGLARTAGSMEKIQEVLESRGYKVSNIDYPSREKTVEELAGPAIEKGLQACEEQSADRIYFVTHSMGGILLRQYLSASTLENLARVVMLAPPNQGSEVVDNLRNTPGFALLNGPAGLQLGTDDASIPASLGPVNFDLGVIAGTASINLVLSTYLPNPDDGKVSVESAKVEGMCDFLTVDKTHTFIMRDDDVIEQVIYYFENGRFKRVPGEPASMVVSVPDHCTSL